MNQRNHPKINQEFFAYLPSEITINILSRLPVRTVISCKCVCKSWLDLVETREFAKSHLANSVPGLAIFHESERRSGSYKIFEFEDMLDLEHHELCYNSITKFGFPHASVIQGSVNGLLLLRSSIYKPNGLYICNPITRDCIQLHCPFFVDSAELKVVQVTFGFGASKTTGQHKVVKISREAILDELTQSFVRVSDYDCQVYTLGTGSWRSIALGAPLWYNCDYFGAFLDGNLHWLASDLERVPQISCLDLETELFTTFSSPTLRGSARFSEGVFALEDCLCICDIISDEEIVIWLMKEYGVGSSWTKEFVICNIPDFSGRSYGVVYPIKFFKDGDILMAWKNHFLFYYSSKTKTTQKIDMIKVHSFGHMDAILHTSSFFSLKSFRMENVSSF